MKSGRLPVANLPPLWLRRKAVRVVGTRRIRNGTNRLAWSDSRNRLVLALGQGERREQEKMNVKVGAASHSLGWRRESDSGLQGPKR
jgi:hypothetical protein